MERRVYRIIDANFNRAREALRVIEDYCRFALDSDPLTSRAKQIRHELSACVTSVGTARLLTARDTLADVGVGKQVPSQLSRTSLSDCLTAGCKRLTEALRVLAETVQTTNPNLAPKIEKLRYDTYTLEKDIFIFADTTARFSRVRLYVIITSNLPVDVFSLTESCIAGGADCLQLRAKDIPDDRLFAVAEEFVSLCRDAGVVSIINDRVDIAVAAGADGIHLGQNDLPLEKVRVCQLTPLITGKSTHSLDQLESACRENPTYIALGPVFSTGTKPAAEPVGLEYVKTAVPVLRDRSIASVAIGGITLDNIEKVLSAGSQAVAVCSAITDSPDPKVACKALKQRILDFQNH